MEKSKKQNIIEWIACILVAVIISLLIRYFIGTPTVVKQTSMYPTLIQDERLWLNRWVKTIKKMPERGEIITFERPSKIVYDSKEIDKLNPVAKYEYENKNIFSNIAYHVLDIGKECFIKRVIALPGEHVKIKNEKVYINDEELKEPYLQDDVVTEIRNGIGYDDFIVPDNCVFAMGDNRENSMDCRDFGCIPLEKIESKVWIRITPLNRFGKIDK